MLIWYTCKRKVRQKIKKAICVNKKSNDNEIKKSVVKFR